MSLDIHDKLVRKLLEPVLEQCLRNIQEDPKRGIRKLIDLGWENAASPYQQESFEAIQKMLEQDESPYYDFIRKTIEKIDHKKLICFSLNHGWNSQVVGTLQRLRYVKQHHCKVPCHVIWHLGGEKDALDEKTYHPLMEDTQQMGVYQYSLFLDGSQASVEKAISIAGAEEDCAFFVFLRDNVDIPSLERFSSLDNSFLLLDGNQTDWQSSLHYMQEKKCFCGVYKTYADQPDAEEITSGRWMDQLASSQGTFAVFLPKKQCPVPYRESVSAYVEASRKLPQVPVFTLDFVRDILKASRPAPDTFCGLSIASNGNLSVWQDNRAIDSHRSLKSMPLTEILRQISHPFL